MKRIFAAILGKLRRWLRRWRLPEYVVRNLDMGKHIADGLAAGIAEAEQHPLGLDGLAAFADSLQELAHMASQTGEALCAFARALPRVNLIDQYATRKEAHYIAHARKARTRKKYRNRVLRRARRVEKKGTKHEERTHCT